MFPLIFAKRILNLIHWDEEKNWIENEVRITLDWERFIDFERRVLSRESSERFLWAKVKRFEAFKINEIFEMTTSDPETKIMYHKTWKWKDLWELIEEIFDISCWKLYPWSWLFNRFDIKWEESFIGLLTVLPWRYSEGTAFAGFTNDDEFDIIHQFFSN